jgi:RNA polymerase-interacting CarD/CdnL/TRCF family regulator
MNFNQGDCVVHRRFGIGTIVSIEEMNFTSNKPRRFFRINFLNTTVWIPVNDTSKGGLRPITSKNQLTRYREVLKSQPITLDIDFRRRKIELENRMDKGSFQGLCEVIRDLNAFNLKKSLNYTEKNILSQTRKALVLEWSTASGITPIEALSEINGCLYKGSQSSHHV